MNNIKYVYWFQETTDVRNVLIRIKLTPVHGIKNFLVIRVRALIDH